MRSDKAIEILTLAKTCDFDGDACDLEDAIQQGIDALERCRWNYLNPMSADLRRLPSETEEVKP